MFIMQYNNGAEGDGGFLFWKRTFNMENMGVDDGIASKTRSKHEDI